MPTTSVSPFRYSTRALMGLMLNVSLFLGAVMWSLRGPDAGVERMFDGLADWAEQADVDLLLGGSLLVMPVVFLAGLLALPIALKRLGRRPYAGFHFLGYAALACLAVAWWFVAGGSDAPLVVARLSLPLAIAAAALAIEVAVRGLPRPYWGVVAVALLMVVAYVDFVVIAWAWGGKF